MSNNWTTKEKLVLFSDVLEFGDQSESWLMISNDLQRTFNNNLLSQTKKDARYSMKNCKQEYRILVERYKSEWIEQQSTNPLKSSLVKFIWIQLKSTYQNELTIQLNESRKKLTEFCLRLESVIKTKSHRNELPTVTSHSANDTANSIILPQQIEQDQQQTTIVDSLTQTMEMRDDVTVDESKSSSMPTDNQNVRTMLENWKDESSTIVSNQFQVKQETTIESNEENLIEFKSSLLPPDSTMLTTPISTNLTHEISRDQSTSNESSATNLSSEQQNVQSDVICPSNLTLNNSTRTSIESTSSIPSTLKTNGENKTDSIRSSSSTTTKYHVYFSPKSSTSNGNTKAKLKKRSIDETKEEIENESTIFSDSLSVNQSIQIDLSKRNSSSSATCQTTTSTQSVSVHSSLVTAPITRRSINTRSAPNNLAEQEEEKSRRFSAMLSEKPNSWQSQANAIIQYILSQKQGYLFEFEITDEIAPKYHQFVRRPIALDTIRKHLESNTYLTKEHFQRDIYLMLYNAMKYNPRSHHVHRAAKHLFQQTLPLFHLSTQDIQSQITRRNSLSSHANNPNETPSTKRQRIK